MYELMVESSFSAAHALRGYQGRCERLHGHTFRVQVLMSGKKVNPTGMVMDFEKIKKILSKLLEEFDHTHLNELRYFKKENPSAENIAKTIFEKMAKKLPKESLAKVVVWESPTASAAYWN